MNHKRNKEHHDLNLTIETSLLLYMRYELINQTNLLGPLWPSIKTRIKLSFHKGRPYSLTRARIYI